MNDELDSKSLSQKSEQNNSVLSIIKKFELNSSKFENLTFYFQGIVEYNIDISEETYYFNLFLRKVEIGESNWVEIMMYDISSSKKIEKADQAIYLKEKILSKIAHEFKTPLICVIALAEEIYGYLNEYLTRENYYLIKKKIRHVRDLSNYTLFLISDITKALFRDPSKQGNSILIEENDKNKFFLTSDIGNKGSELEKEGDSKSIINISKNKKDTQMVLEEVFLFDILKFCYRILKTLLIYNKNKISYIKPKKDFDKELTNLKIKTDPLRLKQILLNLVSNAVKFTKFGSITLVAKKDDKNSCLKIGVQDTGMGIKSEDLHKVFKDFKMLDEHTDMNFFGSGLGLSISLNLAELLGYQLRVHSQPNEGSFFYLNIGYENLINVDFVINKNSSSGCKLKSIQDRNSNKKLQIPCCSNVYFNEHKQEDLGNKNPIKFKSQSLNYHNLNDINLNKKSLVLRMGLDKNFNLKKKFDTCKTLIPKNIQLSIQDFDKYKKKSEIDGSIRPNTILSLNNTKSTICSTKYSSNKILGHLNQKLSLFQKQEDISKNSHHNDLIHLQNKSNVKKKQDLIKEESVDFSFDSSKTLKQPIKFNFENLKRLKLKSKFITENEDIPKISNKYVFNTNYFNKNPHSKVEINNNFLVNQKNSDSISNSISSSEDDESMSDSFGNYESINEKNIDNNFLIDKPQTKKSQNIVIKNQIANSKSISNLKSKTVNQIHRQSITNLNTILSQGNSENKKNFEGQVQPIPQSQINFLTYKILIIDDNIFILNFLENLILKILKEYNVNNYKILRGSDGVDLIKNIIDDQKSGNMIKCVFIDENMEYLNGSESLQIIRRLEASNKVKSVPIVKFTAEDVMISPTSLNNIPGDLHHNEFYLNKPPEKKDVLNLLKLFKIVH